MKLAIGCPVFERAWILPIWFKSIEANLPFPKEDVALCFAYSKSHDGTYEQLRLYGEPYGNLLIYEFDLPTYSGRENVTRFHTLADLRNGLLDMVKETEADYFLSWDNDCLFKPEALAPLFDTMNEEYIDAAGALMDMGGNDDAMRFPSYMDFERAPGDCATRDIWENYIQQDSSRAEIAHQVDIIMAVKLMRKSVYSNTRYRWDMVGEDIGWCRDCEAQGYNRYLVPTARGYHIYDKYRALKVLVDNQDLEYPEILDKLKDWYK